MLTRITGRTREWHNRRR